LAERGGAERGTSPITDWILLAALPAASSFLICEDLVQKPKKRSSRNAGRRGVAKENISYRKIVLPDLAKAALTDPRAREAKKEYDRQAQFLDEFSFGAKPEILYSDAYGYWVRIPFGIVGCSNGDESSPI